MAQKSKEAAERGQKDLTSFQKNLLLAQSMQQMDSKQALAFAVGQLLRDTWRNWKENYDERGLVKAEDRKRFIDKTAKDTGLPSSAVGRLYDTFGNPKTQEMLKQTGAMIDEAKKNIPQINQDTTKSLAPFSAGTPNLDWQNPNQQPDVPAWYNRDQQTADAVLPIPQGLLGDNNQLTGAASTPQMQDTSQVQSALENISPSDLEELRRQLQLSAGR